MLRQPFLQQHSPAYYWKTPRGHRHYNINPPYRCEMQRRGRERKEAGDKLKHSVYPPPVSELSQMKNSNTVRCAAALDVCLPNSDSSIRHPWEPRASDVLILAAVHHDCLLKCRYCWGATIRWFNLRTPPPWCLSCSCIDSSGLLCRGASIFSAPYSFFLSFTYACDLFAALLCAALGYSLERGTLRHCHRINLIIMLKIKCVCC